MVQGKRYCIITNTSVSKNDHAVFDIIHVLILYIGQHVVGGKCCQNCTQLSIERLYDPRYSWEPNECWHGVGEHSEAVRAWLGVVFSLSLCTSSVYVSVCANTATSFYVMSLFCIIQCTLIFIIIVQLPI